MTRTLSETSELRSSACLHVCSKYILCEKDVSTEPTPVSLPINATSHWPRTVNLVKCPQGHYIHQFLGCDIVCSWWTHDAVSTCEGSVTPSLSCRDQIRRVPYTLVCDHRADCVDGSDENFCTFPPCLPDQVDCDGKQCVDRAKLCDKSEDCINKQDERGCKFEREKELQYKHIGSSRPAAVYEYLDRLYVREYPQICPSTHFRCQDGEYCLPWHIRCNVFYDCPDRSDETGCATCPGFYRCLHSDICLPFSSLCDSHPECPTYDDELLCNETCPPFCACRGLSFFCDHNFTTSAYPLLRFLDASGSTLTPAHLTENRLLIHVVLAGCGRENLQGFHLPNLLILEFQDNRLSDLNLVHFAGVPQLRELTLSGNPVTLVFEGDEQVHSLRHLDLSRVVLHDLNTTALSAFPNLHVLNLSHSGVQRVQGEGFRSTKQLRVIDVRGCPMTWFPRGMFQGLNNLHTVYGHNLKVCCPKILPPQFNVHNCFAPSDKISSCDNLLRSNVYSVCVFVYSLLAIIANVASFVFRTLIPRRRTKQGYGEFVTHLSVSDFLMGVYLAIIGAADQGYRGTYVWNDVSWKHSVTCKVAGFLSLLSSEVSAFIMCLITTDRFIVLRFPFSHLKFTPRTAHLASVVAWVAGVVLVSVPMLPVTSHWEFYSQTGICIPLPITKTDFAGRYYSFGIIIIFNFVVFMFISLGQMGIYWSVRTNTMSMSNTTKKTKDMAIARRLIAVAMTDFLCWFPIGVLGLMASNGFPIPGEVNVAMAIFVLPLNSAVNPCLYTVNVILERRSRAREEKLRALLVAQLKDSHVKAGR